MTRHQNGKTERFRCESDGQRTGIAVTPAGVVWVSTTGGMMRHDPKRDEGFVDVDIEVDGIAQDSFQHVVIDHKGAPVAAAKKRGVIRLDPESGEWENLGPPGTPRSQ